MVYVSPKYKDEKIIDESNSGKFAPSQDVLINGVWRKRGLELPPPEERARQRTEASGFMKPWDGPVWSRDEIRERIKEREQTQTIMSQLLRQKKIPTSDQNGLNYCWGYGPFSAVNCLRAWRNQPYIEWSRESVCAPVKGGSNSGGWGIDALNRMVSHGMLPQNFPGLQRWSRSVGQYTSPTAIAEAAKYKITEWFVLQDRNFLQMMTALLLNHAVAVGYNWWSHEVCGVDPVIIGSTDLGLRIWNSWGPSYGDQGFNILSESRATPDDAVIPVVQIAA